MKTCAFAFLLLATASIAGAQEIDARWKPWLGCWQVSGGTADVCVTAAGTNGVTLATTVAGEPALTQTIVADAASHAITEAGCSGTQRAEWSADGRRLFASADLSCKDQPARTVSGLSLITSSDTWFDVQAIAISGRTAVRVRRYERASRQSPRDAGVSTIDAGTPAFTLDAVKEAAGKVAPEALEAALSETKSRFALNSHALVDLDDAGVPASVIDLMVALSYPDKFQVERRSGSNIDSYAASMFDAEQNQFWGLGYPYMSVYQDYVGSYRYYAVPFGWAYTMGLYGPSFVPYDLTPAPVTGGAVTPTEGARVVDGVGYTRVRPREAQPTASSGDGRASGTSAGRAAAGSSGYSSGSNASGGTSSDSGSSSSTPAPSSGSSGGRTAQPR